MSLGRSSSTDDLALLTARLHLQDLEELNARQKGKGKSRGDAVTSDAQLAMDLYYQMLEEDRREMEALKIGHRDVGSGILDDKTLEQFLEEDALARALPQPRVNQPSSSRARSATNSISLAGPSTRAIPAYPSTSAWNQPSTSQVGQIPTVPSAYRSGTPGRGIPVGYRPSYILKPPEPSYWGGWIDYSSGLMHRLFIPFQV